MPRRIQDLIVGGGAVGVCIARELAARGRTVALLEEGELCAGASHGNAGWIAASHVIPVPHPGLAGQTLKWMLRPDSPFYIRPRPSLALLVWLWRFYRHCAPAATERGARVMAEWHRRAIEHTRGLVEAEGLDCEFAQRGTLVCFADERAFAGGRAEYEHLARLGYTGTVFEGPAARRAEPALAERVLGAIRYDAEADLRPDLFVKQLAAKLPARGVDVRVNAPVAGFRCAGRRIEAVMSGGAVPEEWAPENVILAAGAWTVPLCARLGITLCMEAGKGYSVTLRDSGVNPRGPLSCSEVKVAITPWRDRLRVAGTMELAGIQLDLNRRRVDALLRGARAYLDGFRPEGIEETWTGMRPMSYDGLPIIGRASRLENLYLATGHGMLGLTEAASTGLLLGELITGAKPHVDPAPFAPARCGA